MIYICEKREEKGQQVLEPREGGEGRKNKQKRGFLSRNCPQKEEKR